MALVPKKFIFCAFFLTCQCQMVEQTLQWVLPEEEPPPPPLPPPPQEPIKKSLPLPDLKIVSRSLVVKRLKEVIREKKRTRQAEQQRRKEEAVLKVPILEEKKDDLTIEKIKEEEEVVSSTSLPLQSPVKKRTLKRMKRRMRTGLICDGVRVTQRNSQLENYRLSFSDLPDSLQKELTKMKTFLTRRRLGPQEAPIANVTANKYEEHIRGICGWLIKEKEYKVKDLKSLSVLFPSMKELLPLGEEIQACKK